MKITDLSQEQKSNALLIDKALQNIKLTNPYLRAGILAVAYKESGFKLFAETSYRNTPNQRIIQVFGAARFEGMDITILKQDDRKFFDVVYFRKDLGNNQHDGYNFRGRGFNQITGRYNYTELGKKLGLPLASNPDLLAQPEIAAQALARFFRDSIISGQNSGKFLLRYGIVTTGQIGTIEKGATIAHQANMGWAKVPSQDPTGGYQETLKNAPVFLEWLQTN